MNHDRLIQTLIEHEGLRLKPYVDTVGKITIAVGRNLTDRGISLAEANLMLTNDINNSVAEAMKFSWFKGLNDVRKEAIVMMIFNVGLPRFKSFKKMIEALDLGDYSKAAEEALDSHWASQVGQRATFIALMIETGRYPPSSTFA